MKNILRLFSQPYEDYLFINAMLAVVLIVFIPEYYKELFYTAITCILGCFLIIYTRPYDGNK